MLGKVFLWELRGRKIYLMILFFLLALVNSMAFEPVTVRYEIGLPVTMEDTRTFYSFSERFTPGSLIDTTWNLKDMWWLFFPLVTGFAVYTFTYEIDKGIMRTYMLSGLKRRTLFATKLATIFFATFVPLAASLAIAYAFSDPILLRANPAEAYLNYPRKLLLYTVLLYSMIGLATFAANVFSKPLSAFTIPLSLIYFLNTIHLSGVEAHILPRCIPDTISRGFIGIAWEQPGLMNITFLVLLRWIIVSTALILASFVIFVRRDFY